MHKTIYGTLVWFVATLFVIYAFCLNTAGAVFSEAIKNTLSATDIGVSYATGAFIIGFALMQIPAGYLLDRFNARYIVGTAIFLLALGNIAISFSSNLYVYSIANFIQGMGASFDFITACILINQWFAPRMFPILTGLIETLAFIAAAIIHYFLLVALKNYSWQAVYQSLAIFGFILCFITLCIVKTPKDYVFKKDLSLKQSLSIVCSSTQTWLCAIAAATSFGVLLAYAGLWFMRIQKYYSVGDTQALLIGGMIFIGIGIGTPILGWLSNRLKSRKLVLHLSLVLGNMFLLMALYLPRFTLDSNIIIEIVSFLMGFFLSGSMLIYTMVSEMSTNSTRGVAISITNSSVFIFNTVLLLIPYLFMVSIKDTFFTYLWILPFCILISILLVYFLKETYPEQSCSY